MKKRFNNGIVGGTFDLLHQGHKALLEQSFLHSEYVTIGLSLPELYKHKFMDSSIQDYKTREQALLEYLKVHSWDTRSTIVPLKDFYGTTLTDSTLEAIFVTKETQENAEIINLKRHKKGFKALRIITVDYVTGDDGKTISSKRIRAGLINREGKSYELLFKKKPTFVLPDGLRKVLQQPHGSIIKDSLSLTTTHLLIAVGDVVSSSLRDEKILPAVSIIDGKTRRANLDAKVTEKYFSNLTPAFTNNHGTINALIVPVFLQALLTYSQTTIPQTILVEGEEDLLALPAILLSPLGSTVIYGQYNVGMIGVKVTEEKKEEIKSLIEQF